MKTYRKQKNLAHGPRYNVHIINLYIFQVVLEHMDAGSGGSKRAIPPINLDGASPPNNILS